MFHYIRVTPMIGSSMNYAVCTDLDYEEAHKKLMEKFEHECGTSVMIHYMEQNFMDDNPVNDKSIDRILHLK